MPRIVLKVPGREQLELSLDADAGGQILTAKLTGIGDRQFLKSIDAYRKYLQGKINDLPLPEGQTPADLLISEAILRARNQWNPVYKEEEICHCRSVPLKVVDDAVVCGAHTPEIVSAWTSASTACGTCRPDVEAHLRFRLRTGK